MSETELQTNSSDDEGVPRSIQHKELFHWRSDVGFVETCFRTAPHDVEPYPYSGEEREIDRYLQAGGRPTFAVAVYFIAVREREALATVLPRLSRRLRFSERRALRMMLTKARYTHEISLLEKKQ